MKRHLYFVRALFFVVACLVGRGILASAATTYKLTQVTSVKAGGLYVFEQDGYVMYNKISSNHSDAVSTISTYITEGLAGNEPYVWTLESANKGFYMRNLQSQTSGRQYLKNETSTTMTFSAKKDASSWSFSFQEDHTVLIQNASNNRFLGFMDANTHVYKAYEYSNIAEYNAANPHSIVVYELKKMNTLTLADGVSNNVTTGSTPYGTPLTLTATPATDYTGTLTATSANSAVATVSVTGNDVTITPVAVGTTTITVTAPATTAYTEAVSKDFTIAVSAPEGLSQAPADAPATITATIAASGYGTCCSPYPLDLSSTPAGCKAWYVDDVSGTTVTFCPVTSTISGGVPFILYGTPGSYSLTVANASTNTLPRNWLRGSLAPTFLMPTFTENGVEYTCFGLVGGTFVKAESGTLPAGKAYLPVPTNLLPTDVVASRMAIAFSNVTTSVNSLPATTGDTAVSVFDLQGRRIDASSSLSPGIYVICGRKFVKK